MAADPTPGPRAGGPAETRVAARPGRGTVVASAAFGTAAGLTCVAPGLPVGIGATVAVGSRLAFLLADVAGVLLTAPWHRSTVGGSAAPAPAGRPVDSLR